MRDENEIKLKRAYWNGAFDTLNIPENAKSDKLNREKVVAQTWLTALDWILGQSEEIAGKQINVEDKRK
jgi:hypothetical protein